MNSELEQSYQRYIHDLEQMVARQAALITRYKTLFEQMLKDSNEEFAEIEEP